jgi:hypothetical protein
MKWMPGSGGGLGGHSFERWLVDEKSILRPSGKKNEQVWAP